MHIEKFGRRGLIRKKLKVVGPIEITPTVTFDEIDDGKTRLTVQEVGINDEMTGQHDGLRGSLDKLAESLNNKRSRSHKNKKIITVARQRPRSTGNYC